jgi:hypothetical protein
MNKPEKKHVTFYRTEGRFYIGDTARYVFQLPADAPKELERSFLVNLEKDWNYSDDETSALVLARWIHEVYESYFFHTGKSRIKALVDYLESIEDEQEALREAYELEYAKYQVGYWTARVEELTPESEAV